MVDIDFRKMHFTKVVICNDLTAAREQAVKPILSEAARHRYCGQDQFALRLGLEEAISNAYRHGNACDPDKKIHVRWAVNADSVVICVTDEGCGFDPLTVPDPRTPENREKPCGRGLLLMKAYLTDIRFNGRGNEVCMIKKRKQPLQEPAGS